MGVSLLAVVQVFNVSAWVLAKQVTHSAVDQGVRAGAKVDVDPVSACEDRLRQALGNMAGDGASASCAADAEQVRARVRIPLRSWLPGLPDSSTEVAAVARREGLR